MKRRARTAQAVSDRAAEAAARARAAELEAVRAAAAKRAELARLAREKLHDSGLDERAAELKARLRDAPATQQAVEAARTAGDRTYDRLGAWLTESGAAERMNLTPPKRRFPVWLLGLLGVGVGFAVARLAAARREDAEWSEGLDVGGPATGGLVADPLEAESAELASVAADPGGAGPATESVPEPASLDARIRSALRTDPRTAALPPVVVNVVESTVFVRGSVPPGFDEEDLRAVVAEVEGVTDVDMQVRSDAAG